MYTLDFSFSLLRDLTCVVNTQSTALSVEPPSKHVLQVPAFTTFGCTPTSKRRPCVYMVHSLSRLLHSILANLRLSRGIGVRWCEKRSRRSLKKLSYAFLVTLCRFKVSGLAFKMATSCAVGKYRWDMTPTASVKLTATNTAEKSDELR